MPKSILLITKRLHVVVVNDVVDINHSVAPSFIADVAEVVVVIVAVAVVDVVVGAYSFGLRIWDFAEYSLAWGPAACGPRVSGSLALRT